jgi:hypothetical protein
MNPLKLVAIGSGVVLEADAALNYYQGYVDSTGTRGFLPDLFPGVVDGSLMFYGVLGAILILIGLFLL